MSRVLKGSESRDEFLSPAKQKLKPIERYKTGNPLMRAVNKLTSVFYVFVLLLIMNFVRHIVKVAVDLRGDSRVDPQTTLAML